MSEDLIFDIGLHHGDDSAFYLSRGFRVVGIEANPRLADQCERRFAAEIAAGRMTVVCVGIGDQAGRFPFWVHHTHDEWSSFRRDPIWADGDFECIDVACVPFKQILDQYGTPHYLKVDIEGNDPCVINALGPGHRPKYVSFEAGPNAVRMLCKLESLGYDSYKIVDQTTHNEPQVALRHTNEDLRMRYGRRLRMWKWRVTRKYGLDRTALGALWRFAGQATAKTAAATEDNSSRATRWIFPVGSSGPFGEEAPGQWQPIEKVLYNWLHRYFRRFDRGTLLDEPWYDIHARRP